MRVKSMSLLLACAWIVSACASATPTPSAPPSQTLAVTPTQPQPEPVATESPAGSGQRVVTFESDDSVTLGGTLFGQGDMAIVLSHMRPSDQTSWHAFAQTLAENGYTALAYDFRGYGASGGTQELGMIDRDVRAAVKFLKEQGASRFVLIGASMGGTASIKVAASVVADGLVVLSSPHTFEGLQVTADDLNLAGRPSLWLSSRDDALTPHVEWMYGQASEPKTIHIYDGSAHGTDIFQTANGADLSQRILDFLATLSP